MALTFCVEPGCRELVARGRCRQHARAREWMRPNREARRWYYIARWRDLRRQVLEAQPLCVECLQVSRVEPAVDVDHIVPHGGDYDRFFDPQNLQGLCKLHHSQKTQSGL